MRRARYCSIFRTICPEVGGKPSTGRHGERPRARNPAPAVPRGKRDYIFRKIDGPTPLSTLGGDSSHEIFTMEVAVSAHMICHCGRLNSFEAIKTRAELAKRISDLWTGTLQLDGVWIVQSDRTSDEIRDALLSCLNLGDALLVVGAGQDAAWAGFKPAETDWLVEHI